MIDIVINEIELDILIETKIPKIPEKGDKIGAWINGDWRICEIYSFIYDFNEDGSFFRVEINVIAR